MAKCKFVLIFQFNIIENDTGISIIIFLTASTVISFDKVFIGIFNKVSNGVNNWTISVFLVDRSIVNRLFIIHIKEGRGDAYVGYESHSYTFKKIVCQRCSPIEVQM